jgi:hypothetical protein
MGNKLTLGILAAVLVASPAVSHTLILDTRSSPAIPSFAHDGIIEPIAGAMIESVFVLGNGASATQIEPLRSPTNAAIALPQGTRAAVVRYVGQNAGRAPDGSRRIGSRASNPDVAEIARSEVETLAILRTGARLGFLPPAALRLEPIEEIVDRRVGSRVQIRLLLNGQPLPAASIRLQALGADKGGPTATTDANGIASAIIPNAGANLFVANYADCASNDPDAHIIRRQASLSFVARAALPTRPN